MKKLKYKAMVLSCIDPRFQSKDFEALMADEDTQKYVYDLICEKAILKYDSGKLGIDDISVTDEFTDE